jgi:hypothetical protein
VFILWYYKQQQECSWWIFVLDSDL